MPDPQIRVTAEAVETARVERAEVVEQDRSHLADAVESDRADLAGVVEAARVEFAATVEQIRKEHNAHAEAQRRRRAGRVNRQIIVLASFLVAAFIVLAIRSETNASDIRNTARNIQVAQYQTCLQTAERTQTINPGRVALTELLSKLVEDSVTLTEQAKADAQIILQAGLVVPPVKCGAAP